MSDEQNIKEAFDAYDANKSGKISCSHLAKILKQLGYADKSDVVAAAVVKEVDRSVDGQISFGEFKAALAKNPK